ncbi:pollen-specific leucine-rich repeat extensin-like protein 1 [Dendrobium catenatum]|uniref:pollen-specific leucine-rich repeat extensin-like protein 1 n=1 Tax=Dendrobium catenatum TaxID=906689 RepID=UPI00109FD3C5|nr:pollen-specific leucine-rich repeat extensin-like protein 1 [Dendrobium catenatum]
MRVSSATIPRYSSSSLSSSSPGKRHQSSHEYPPLELPLRWHDPPPKYPQLEHPMPWRDPPPDREVRKHSLPNHLFCNQPVTLVRDSPPLINRSATFSCDLSPLPPASPEPNNSLPHPPPQITSASSVSPPISSTPSESASAHQRLASASERDSAPGDERKPAPCDERNSAPGDEGDPAPGDEREPALGDERDSAPRDEPDSAPDPLSCSDGSLQIFAPTSVFRSLLPQQPGDEGLQPSDSDIKREPYALERGDVGVLERAAGDDGGVRSRYLLCPSSSASHPPAPQLETVVAIAKLRGANVTAGRSRGLLCMVA